MTKLALYVKLRGEYRLLSSMSMSKRVKLANSGKYKLYMGDGKKFRKLQHDKQNL